MSEPYKTAILKLLNSEYKITEKDFVSAEIEIVPAAKARDLGFDRALIAAYGHDDKVCIPGTYGAYGAGEAFRTCVTIPQTKEIGSYANSGAQSVLYENFLMELLAKSCGELTASICLPSARLWQEPRCFQQM